MVTHKSSDRDFYLIFVKKNIFYELNFKYFNIWVGTLTGWMIYPYNKVTGCLLICLFVCTEGSR